MTKLHFLSQRGDDCFRTQMMGFIIQTSNGHLIAVDGGNKQDTEYFHGYLDALCGGKKPIIDLWILTHPHADHTDVLYEMYRHYAPDFEVKALMYDFLDFELATAYEPNDAHTTNEMTRLLPAIKQSGTRVITPKAGETYTVDNVKLEILRTPAPGLNMNFINNSSLVIRMEAEGQSVLFTGDLGEEAGDEVLKNVPHEKLRCDFVQLAHHGQNGVKQSFYEVCAPRACLWCTPKWLWENNVGDGFNTYIFKTVTTRSWIEQLGVKHNFIAKDGTHVITLPFEF